MLRHFDVTIRQSGKKNEKDEDICFWIENFQEYLIFIAMGLWHKFLRMKS